MKRLALASNLVLLLSHSYSLHSADASPQRASIGNFKGSDERCEMAITLLTDRWSVKLICHGDEKRSKIFKQNVVAAALWVLLDDGKTAIPIRPIGADPMVGVAICMGGGCTYSAGALFELSGDPIAVVVRYEDGLHVLPITKEILDKVKEP